jgi:hypothetical protein
MVDEPTPRRARRGVCAIHRQGQKLTFKQVPREVFASWFPDAGEVAAMLAYFEAHTYLGSTSLDAIALATKVAGQKPTNFAAWAFPDAGRGLTFPDFRIPTAPIP